MLQLSNFVSADNFFQFPVIYDQIYLLLRISDFQFLVSPIKVTMTSKHKAVLSLYKVMLRESEKFADFNYRGYALRRIKDGFRANSKLTEEALIDAKIQHAKDNLSIIKRQSAIGQLFNLNTKLTVEIPKH